MKFTLKDYQTEAVGEVLQRLQEAREDWQGKRKRKSAFSLTAPTGAGKTVMAAAVFEALLHGDDNLDFDADRGAVILWFSDNPSLNEQTRFRLMDSSDRLNSTEMEVVEYPFNRARFQAGKIYFLNTQKLGKGSLLVRGFEEEGGFPEMRPDAQAHTLWDTLKNTIEDESLTLYLVLDEAHRGMREEAGRKTLVQRLINGDKGVPGIPVVWGISATVERFNTAMETAQGHIRLPDVRVDSSRVLDSGLLKDTVALAIPDDETGGFDTVLVGRAADKLRESAQAWADYAAQQANGESVAPLMVLQVEDKPNPADIAKRLDAIFERWDDLPPDAVAHVFGEHKEEQFGQYKVPYIAPERVQGASWVRVLLAKNAISTGWDCPRAEVMVSLRAAQDKTHIAQLLGRMVRTPLARRIPGNDRLNTVDCLLPKFDKATVHEVVHALQTGSELQPGFGRVLVNPAEMKPNPSVPDAVWHKLESLPSQMRPQRGAKPPVRLTALAHELASDGLLKDAGKQAHAHLHAWLDDFIQTHADEFAKKRATVAAVEGKTIIANLQDAGAKEGTFVEKADAAVWDAAYRLAARTFSPDIARTYTQARAQRHACNAGEDYVDALLQAREDVAALGLMADLKAPFDAEATNLSDVWLREFHDAIKQLADDRQDAYRQITALSLKAQDVDLSRPVSRLEMTAASEGGKVTAFAVFPHHLLCDGKGLYPAELNGWETRVLDSEMSREGFLCWYRNPNQPSQDSLGIAYMEEGEVKIVRPDFLFFVEEADGSITVDIVDPHDPGRADALPKLRGLCRYVEAHGGIFRRVESVAEVKGKLRALDLSRAEVRNAIAEAEGASSLYAGVLAVDYR
ncbi:MAG: DEAD/DEAH box helicase family protein [Ottowia sp.]|uniref:DEAD/DEAH box helicase n=1 Tax=Ottowia sp. TaxID=1898956 RepID=UPI0039E4B230